MGALLEVLVDSTPEELFYTYEAIETDKSYREFLFPAEFLNNTEKCRVRPLVGEAEEDAEQGPFWNEYPPGEPEKTLAKLRAEEAEDALLAEDPTQGRDAC